MEEYFDFATLISAAIILTKIAYKVTFVLKSAGKGAVDLSATTAGRPVLFVVSRITQEVGLNTSMVISRLLADGDQIIDCRLPVAVLSGASGLLFVKGYDQVIC
jgi:hypothetical protein